MAGRAIMTKVLFLVAGLAFSTFVQAKDECVLSIDRTPCAGKETEARKPYSGKNPTEEKRGKATTEQTCLDEGAKAVKIIRKGILAKKVVTVTFAGKEAGKKEDTHACN